MKLSTNFNLDEFASADGIAPNGEVLKNLTELAKNLEILRKHLGQPIRVTSGFRSKEYNATIKNSATNSKHIFGMAADIQVAKIKPEQVAKAIELLIKEGKMKQGGLGVYKTFVHYDIYFDGKKIRRWKG
jgi:uncharacterized protein YcbK (DUF882 family)